MRHVWRCRHDIVTSCDITNNILYYKYCTHALTEYKELPRSTHIEGLSQGLIYYILSANFTRQDYLYVDMYIPPTVSLYTSVDMCFKCFHAVNRQHRLAAVNTHTPAYIYMYLPPSLHIVCVWTCVLSAFMQSTVNRLAVVNTRAP